MANCELTWDELKGQLRPASFGGVKFYVDGTSDTTGHRVVSHQFPGSNIPYNESLGRDLRTYSLNGYFSGSNWRHGRDALRLAAESGAALTLRHPFYNAFILGKATSLSIDHSKEKLGYVSFTLDVVEVVSTLTFSGIVGYLFQIRNAFSSLMTAASSRYSSTISDTSFESPITLDDNGKPLPAGGQLYVAPRDGAGVRPFSDTVRLELIEAIEQFATDLNEARINLTFYDGSDLEKAIQALYDAASSIIDGEDIEPFLTDIISSFRGAVADNIKFLEEFSGDSAVESNPTGQSTQSSFFNSGSDGNFDALGEYSDKSIGYRAAADALEDLIWTGVDDLVINTDYAVGASRSASAQRLADVFRDTRQLFRLMAGGMWAEMVVSADYGSSTEATRARNNLVKWLESERNLMLQLGAEEYSEFDLMMGLVMDRMNNKWADARPVLTKELNQLTSSVAMAYEIYEDPTQAVALWRRNGGYDPAMLGPCLEFIAPDQ